MKKGFSKSKVEVWGGIECTINRVDNWYMDQLSLSGHYERASEDIERFKQLGIKALRYPVLWEKHSPEKETVIDWTFAAKHLDEIKKAGIQPIVGLCHHGSGPLHVNFFDDSFAEGLGEYAAKVAAQFPWVEYYTPVNEPLTTARFCALYGHWYPHRKNWLDFLRVLLAECKGTVLAMQAIRKINPHAKLVQTEDLGKTHSTPRLQYQADFENERRWLSIDLLCGKVNKQHTLWKCLTCAGVPEEDLLFFIENPCPPDILGINHYLTSERWLDERLEHFPAHTHGGNGGDSYADVEAVRIGRNEGPEVLFGEAWERYKLPIAITEVHLHCTRDEQLRWFYEVWNAVNNLKSKGANMVAVTAWAMLGSFDWCSLLTKPNNIYEAGLFDVRANPPRPTALTKFVGSIAAGNDYSHPILDQNGWWRRPCALEYFHEASQTVCRRIQESMQRPLLIIGKSGTLAQAFVRICQARELYHVALGRNDIDVSNPADIERIINHYKPWAIINTAGYVRVDDAEKECEECFALNTVAPKLLAEACQRHGVQFVTYSSDLVFDGKKRNPYLESDFVSPLNIYGRSKAMAEEAVQKAMKNSLIIRTSAFFGPWDRYNFVYHALRSAKEGQEFVAAKDVLISPTYVPDLVNSSLDLLIDEADGIWNISNQGSISWAVLANEVADRGGYHPKNFKEVRMSEMNLPAPRPDYSVLTTEKGFELPSLEDALSRFFKEQHLV